MNNSDELIQQLGAQFESERHSGGSRKLLSWIWISGSVLLVGLPLGFMALRTDIKQHSVVFGFWIYFFTLATSAASLLYLAWLSAIPGKEVPLWLERLALGSGLLGFVGLFQMGLGTLAQESLFSGLAFSGIRCALTEVALGILPSVLFFFVFRRLAPTALSRTGVFGLGAAALLSASALALHCASNQPVHILAWHMLPVILISLLGASLARRLLHW